MGLTRSFGDLANLISIDGSNNVTFSGGLIGQTIKKYGGLASQFLKADGSVDSNSYVYTKAGIEGLLTGNISSHTHSYEPVISPSLPTTKGGTGLTTIGAALQTLRVNAAGSSLEWATLSATPIDLGSVTGQLSYWNGAKWTPTNNIKVDYATDTLTAKAVKMDNGTDNARLLKYQFGLFIVIHKAAHLINLRRKHV